MMAPCLVELMAERLGVKMVVLTVASKVVKMVVLSVYSMVVLKAGRKVALKVEMMVAWTVSLWVEWTDAWLAVKKVGLKVAHLVVKWGD